MITVIVAIRDSAVNVFMQPFFTPAVGGAIRAFSDEVNRKDSEMHKHPDDYVLFELGAFDNEVGAMVSLPEPRQLARGKDVFVKGD